MPKDVTNYRPDVEGTVGYYALEQGPYGRTLTIIDYGEQLGVKLEIDHPTEQTESVAMLLTPKQTAELTEWLAHSHGQEVTRMPLKLAEVCQRVIKQKGLTVKLQHGDKAAIRAALKVLKDFEETAYGGKFLKHEGREGREERQ